MFQKSGQGTKSLIVRLDRQVLSILFCLSFLLFGLFLEILGVQSGALKFIRFATPLLFAIILLDNRNENAIPACRYGNRFTGLLLCIYLIASALTFMTNTFMFSMGFTYRNIVNIVLITSPAFSFFVITKFARKSDYKAIIYFLFCSYIVLYTMLLVSIGVTWGEIRDSMTLNIFTDSNRPTEDTSSLFWGFFALFFLSEKKYVLFALSLALVILAGKRIAIAGTFFATMCYLMVSMFPSLWKLIGRRWVMIAACGVMLAIPLFWNMLYSGVFDDIITRLTGMSTDGLFMGRLSIAADFYSVRPDDTNYFIGYGLGYVENALYYLCHFPTPFHNEHLRLYLELGPVIFVAWCYVMIKYSLLNKLSLSAFILLLFMMQTDNILTYETVMYSYFVVTIYSFVVYNKDGEEPVDTSHLNSAAASQP
jgi:hypothetical protein